MRNAVTVISALVVVLGAQTGAQQPSLRSAIEAANQNFMAVFQKGDEAALAAMYTTDGEVHAPNAEIVTGREGIAKMWRSVMDQGISSAKLTTREVEGAGATAWESGNYELFGKDGAPLDRGKYIVVWKRVNGQWLIHRDIWNSSQPAAR